MVSGPVQQLPGRVEAEQNFISIIIAIYNRKDELFELLQSLSFQTNKRFEVIVVDDGSSVDLRPTLDIFSESLDIQYFKKQNSGPGLTRNYGSRHARGSWLIFLDSDVIAESDYIANVYSNLARISCDAFGGADKAHRRFTMMQKAISYAMTSLLTTGGIRGKKTVLGKFQLRSFNMGIRKDVFNSVGGFSNMRIGEDPDLTMTLWEKGYRTELFPDIAVYHKRRTDFGKFSRQVYQFGCARPILNQRHPNYVKLSFAFPSLFMLGYLLGIVNIIFLRDGHLMFLYGLYTVLLAVDSLWKTKNIALAGFCVIASYVQLFSYGYGFLESWIKLNVIRMSPKEAFPHHFS